ncbi:MAG: hypothetical protein AAB490_04225 [Patescibacteria group bacterium]
MRTTSRAQSLEQKIMEFLKRHGCTADGRKLSDAPSAFQLKMERKVATGQGSKGWRRKTRRP